jgi:hypothetical protein
MMYVSHSVFLIDRRLTFFFATAMLIGSHQSYGSNGAVAIARAVKGITIDGDLGDWPKDVPTYSIARLEHGDKLGSTEDLNAHFRVTYNTAEHAL